MTSSLQKTTPPMSCNKNQGHGPFKGNLKIVDLCDVYIQTGIKEFHGFYCYEKLPSKIGRFYKGTNQVRD